MPAVQPVLHSDQAGLSELVGVNLALAKETGLLVDGDVGAAKTATTMKAAIATAASTKHAEFSGYVPTLQRAIDYGAALGILSDSNVQGVTTIDELIAITEAASGHRGPLALE